MFELEDLDCAVCAAKIEAAVKELEGVDNVSVNFMTQKMTIETNQNIDEVMKKWLNWWKNLNRIVLLFCSRLGDND